MSKNTNTRIPYEYMKPQLKNCDPIDIAQKSGTIFDPYKRQFHVYLMGRTYFVQYPCGEVYDENHSEDIELVIKTLLLRYLINARGMAPAESDINYHDVPGGQVYYPNFLGRCIKRLARIVNNDLKSFGKAMESINGRKTNAGDSSYRFRFMNNIYMTFILWRGDEEFPPNANILFDANVPHYFTAEDLAVVGDVSLNRLKELI